MFSSQKKKNADFIEIIFAKKPIGRAAEAAGLKKRETGAILTGQRFHSGKHDIPT